ncbi:MAG: HYR domain-containing protein [Phycisphaerales bacterium]
MQSQLLSIVAACALTSPLAASEVNTSALSQNGWFSDDTRADGTGTQPAGTNLKSNTLTDLPEQTSGTALHDADILAQIIFGVAPGTVPVTTHGGAVHLRIGPSGSGKSQISHRKDDAGGHGPGSGFGPGFMAQYSWMGDGPSAITASLKFGIKTAEFGSTPVSPRTGENVWDKVLIYEPGNGNGTLSDGVWHTETINYTTGKWWFFDRKAGAGTIGMPLTLSAMSTSAFVFSGSKTIKDVYDLITAPGAKITSVQFGIGSGNADGSVYVNQLDTNVYRSGMLTTFGTGSPYDQNVTPDVIFGAGNANGSYTVDRSNGVELGMRGKLRFPSLNVFNSNGDGTYTFNTGSGTGSPPNPEWNFEWSVNTDWNGTSSYLLDDLNYEIGMDFDPGAGTNYLVFDPITIGEVIPFIPPAPPVVFWDHSIGTNATPNGGGAEAVSGPTYAALLAANNVAQNSWRMTFFDEFPFTFNPAVNGRYEFYLSAFDGAARVARTAITIFALDKVTLTLEGDACQTTDQDPVTPGTQIKVTLHVRNPDHVNITGFQAFLDFDETMMTYVAATSSYSASPFVLHITPTASAEYPSPGSGKLRLDGATMPLSPALTDDALLATLYFTVSSCVGSSVAFDLTQPFSSETSFGGSPIMTDLLDSPTIVSDTVPPVIGAHANITQPADAGSCTQAVVTYTAPSVTDNCDASPTLVCSPPSGSIFPVGTTTVTCIATDDCGNQSMSTFTVTITATNAVDVVVELQGSGPASRCIYFSTDTCSANTSVTLSFTGTAPSVVSATIEVPCGVYSSLCAKDKQHTQWDSSPLTIMGAKYVATSTLMLGAGDTDNDGDVDINDVTLLVAQFGTLAAPGGCPWDGTRNADFSNDGVIGSLDYSILSGSGNWLTTSSCACSLPLEGGGEPKDPAGWVLVHDATTAAADLNHDGRVDVRDVEVLEQRHGLSGELSKHMRNKWH